MMFKLALKILTIFIFTFSIYSQNEESNSFNFDAVFFKGDNPNEIRLDVYLIIPYQSLYFTNIKDILSAKYNALITISDSSFNQIDSKRIDRTIIEKDYKVALGGTGAFDYSQNIFTIKKGSYFIKVTFTDERNNKIIEKTRQVNPVNFDDYNFSLSSILLLSRVEENEGKYKITPHISDDVSDFKEGYFAFFEIYSKDIPKSSNFAYKILNKEGKEIYKSKITQLEIKKNITRHFIKIINPPSFEEGKYFLRIFAIKPTADTNFTDNDITAIAERSIKFQRTFAGVVLNDIDKAVKQLRYVAFQSDIDLIEKAKTIEEKQSKFEDFWKKLDPSPNTERNEAFEEYYSRIEYANKIFKSYGEGWKSDKGAVYVVFGPPFSTERSAVGYDGRVYETWTYRNNKRYTFIDYNGFGDWRLYSPLSISERYKWE